MSFRIIQIMASSLLLGLLSALPAQALFGPVCIPTMRNCMCTHLKPCPVSDPKHFAETLALKKLDETKLKVMGDMKEPLAMMTMAMNGQMPYGIPGLGSLGIDLNGLMAGNLASLGIPSIGGDLVSKLNNLGIDGNLLSSIAKGELGVDAFVKVAQNAGLDLGVLEQAGLGLDRIQQLANGELKIDGVLDLAKSLNLEAGVLKNIGISSDLLIAVSQGQIDANRIIGIAKNAGLDMKALENVGLGIETIANLSTQGPDYVAKVLQASGFDSSITTALGLDAGMIAQISSGQLPPSAINTLVAGTGIDPNALVLPGLNGPIRVTDAIGSNIANAFDAARDTTDQSPGASGMGGGLFSQLTAAGKSSASPPPADAPKRAMPNYDMITIPTSTIPGLKNALDAASGKSQDTGLFSSPVSDTDAMCASDKALISTSMPPNEFGDDVENINMAISGGTLEAFPEAVDEATGAAGVTAAIAMARSIRARNLLVKATEAIDTFDDMINGAKMLEDELAINDTIRAQLMTAKAENASMLTVFTSIGAAQKMNHSNLSPVPIFPQTARFYEQVVESSKATAAANARQIKMEASTTASASAEYARQREKAQSALDNYNLLVNLKVIESTVPDLYFTIDTHEAYKSAQAMLEKRIQAALLTLYGADDADTAWEKLRPQLFAARHAYTDQNKWTQGAVIASAFSDRLTAQTARTEYGTRAIAGYDPETGQATYTTVQTPYSYPQVDQLGDSLHDPYRVENEFALGPGNSAMFGQGNAAMAGPGMSGVIQYYLETLRRADWWGELRRGDADHAMTNAFWTEMIHNAPECLSGPLPFSLEMIAERPDMFDLDKGCTHLYWSYGDPGDYIDVNHLGGADAALWMSKITADRARNITGGEDAVLSQITDTLADMAKSTAASTLMMQGFDLPARKLDAMSEALQKAKSDGSFTVRITL